MSRVSVLISCMHQVGYEIISKSNIQTDVVVINQCNTDNIETFKFLNKKGEECSALIYSTTERGLSKSRNRALQLSGDAEICIICDDDELFPDDYEDIVIKQYELDNALELITFAVDLNGKSYPKKKTILNFFRILQTSSPQITFKRDSILKYNISFDEMMGSGTGNGGGEENKFLLDCLRSNLKMMYCPKVLAKINKCESIWFHGYTERFFQNQGWSVRRLLGDFLGYIYIWYYVLRHYSLYKNDISIFTALKNIHIGYYDRRC